ncbi:MAG: hypothetical protein HC914_13430 [Chloroflexaceae bacterium]|nr:hypothetical protein [Chloroflexaceae bacterium]
MWATEGYHKGGALAPNGQTLAIAHEHGTDLRRVADLTLALTLGEIATDLAFSPDSRFVVGVTRSEQLWRISDGALVATLDQTDRGASLAFTTQQELMIGLEDGTIRVWRVP